MRHPKTKPGDLVPMEIKLYSIRPGFFAVSRLRLLKPSKVYHKLCVILWRNGHQGKPQHITQNHYKDLIEKFNLVEE